MRRPPSLHLYDPAKSITLEIDVAETDVPSLPVDPKEVAPPEAEKPLQRALLLEDRDDFREVLCDHLAFRGFEVTAVPSGIEGLQEIRNGAFDIIICDMLMPRGGGEMFYWAVTRLRPATAKRFIFFTGHRNDPTINYFFQRVNATVLIKPFQLAELDATIETVLRRLM